MLEVIALSEADIREAARGGADRVELVGTMRDDGLSPGVKQVRDAVEVAHNSGIAIRVMLRTRAGFAFREEDIPVLSQLANELRESGADGAVLGFLDPAGKLDFDVLRALDLSGLSLTIHRAIDACTNYFQAWSELERVAVVGEWQISQVLSAGSVAGVDHGLENLLALAKNQFSRETVMAGGGLREDHIPVLKNVGIRAFHVGSAVRPNRDWNESVSPRLVEKWVELTEELSN